MRRGAYLCAMAVLLGIHGVCRASVGIQPVVGKLRKVTVAKGDTLYRIARRNNVAITELIRANHLVSRKVKPGQRLMLPTLYILPRDPKDGIVLNIPEQRVYLFTDGQMRANYPTAIGKPDWQTAQGTFTLIQKKLNPQWQPTAHIVESEHIKDTPVAPGKENPLGDRWMGWSKPGYGFHSTDAPTSVGKVASHGCVRLYPEAAHAMFDRVKVGMTIYSVYEPVEVGKRDNQYYLVVFPDVYNSGLATLAHVRKILESDGILAQVDPKRVERIVANRDGVPHPIGAVQLTAKQPTVHVKPAVAGTTVPPSDKNSTIQNPPGKTPPDPSTAGTHPGQ